MKKILILGAILLPFFCFSQNDNTKKKIFSWFENSSLVKKDNLVIITGGQSNCGTDNQGAQNTGRVTYANMPTYLQTAPANIDYVNIFGAGQLQVIPWAVDPALEWGWFNQMLYVCSSEWTDIIYSKRCVGGTTILPSNGGTFPRSDFEIRGDFAINEANTRWGAGQYNVVVLWDLGETNGLTEPDANAFQVAEIEWFGQIRTNVFNSTIVYNKTGTYQNVDFPYIISTIQPAQNSVRSTVNKIVVGNAGAKWMLQDEIDDYSHYNQQGAIMLGNNYSDIILGLYNVVKTDNIKPVLQTAVVNNALPNQIVLTYSENLNNTILNFWKDFTLNSNRKITGVASSGATVTLTVSENFYAGETISLTLNKQQYYESSICDLSGNIADNFTGQTVTNNVLTVTPTYSNRYTSNFSGGVDGWLGFSGGAVSAPVSIGGETNALQFDASTDTTPLCLKNSVFTGTIGHVYRIRFSAYVPETLLVNAGIISGNYDIHLSGATGGTVSPGLYQYIRRTPLGSQWVDYEFTYTAADTGTSLRVEMSPITLGQSIYLKNFVVDRIIP